MARFYVGSASPFFLLTALLFASAAPAEAQDRGVVQRLVEYGRMPSQAARQTVRSIDRGLAKNAEQGGARYDRLRQAVGRVMFDGPGETRPEYDRRLQGVLDRLREGLDSQILVALFPREGNSAVLCANEFDVTMQECDALMAAAAGERAALPFAAPDDGEGLERALREAGVSRRMGRKVADQLEAVMLGVPRILSRDARGRGLLRLLEQCPGALTQREAQIRAWHVGPTVGMARCIAQKVASGEGAAGALREAEQLLGMEADAARAFLDWGAPDAMEGGGQPVARAPRQGSAQASAASSQNDGQADGGQAAARWVEQARQHFAGRRFPQAAAAYEQAARMSPNDAGVFAGLGAARLAMDDAVGAANAYQQATRLAPNDAGYWTSFARAQAQAGSRQAAIQSLQRALQIAPDYGPARQGLQALGGAPPPAPPRRAPAPRHGPPPARAAAAPAPPPVPTMPEVPARQAIIQVMRPLEQPVQGCHPDYTGRVVFKLEVLGETGEVAQAQLDGELADTPEGECMEGVVKAARFPRFTRERLEIAYPYQL